MTIELNELAFQNADLLLVLADDDRAGWTPTDLARRLERDPSNVRKSVQKLLAQDLLTSATAPALTDAGRAQVEAIRRARNPDAVDQRTARTRWPIDRIRRNPANRHTTSLAVIALADTIEAAGDVLQDVQLTPPDATGVRMLLAGEHRWEAVQRLSALNRLPAALADGIPFTERDVDPAEQILIRIVENSARTNLSPLEDARDLLALADATGWSAREVAKKTGRSPADSETGVRDVQVKIKVAREASEEAIAEYERTGSWDVLRDSVTDKRPAPLPSPSAAPAATSDPTPLEAAIDQVWAADQLSPARAPGEEPGFEVEALLKQDTLTSPFKAAETAGDEPMIVLTSWRNGKGDIGWGWNLILPDGARDDRDPQEFIANAALGKGRTIARLRALWRDRLPVEAMMWLDAQIGPYVVNGQDFYNGQRATEARMTLGWEKRRSNSGGGSSLKTVLADLANQAASDTIDPAEAPAVDAALDATAPAATDIWGRDHNTAVSEAAVLRRVEDFVLGNAGHSTPDYARQLLSAVGVSGPFGYEGRDVVALVDGRLQPSAVDARAANVSPERQEAFAALTAWALNKAFSTEAAS